MQMATKRSPFAFHLKYVKLTHTLLLVYCRLRPNLMSDSTYKIIEKKELKAGEIEVEVEIPYEGIERHRAEAIRDIGKDIEIDGFRKGQAPEKMIVDRVGELQVIEKAAFRAIQNFYPVMLLQEKIEALTQPEITITKIAPKSPLVFKAKVVLMPQVGLPDYKKIAKEVKQNASSEPALEVTEKEIEDHIEYIRKMRAQMLKQADGAETPLPTFDDEFVKTLGNFKDVEDFKNQLKENTLAEKKKHAGQKLRVQMIEKILEESKVNVPDILVDQELERMMGQFRHDVEEMKMGFEEYLKEVKKTEDDLKKEWRTDAEKRAKMNLILPKIADAEKLVPKVEDIERELGHLKEHHKDVDDMHARLYIMHVLGNEEVFKFLENL